MKKPWILAEYLTLTTLFFTQTVYAAAPTFDPTPDDPTALSSQLLRFPGQTQFLNPYGHYGFKDGESPLPKAGQKAGQAARAQQDSDVYKIGKPGTKLLFL